ncbi:hypothetical protein [Clostridium kluyveri]|uniref:Uncharacterized protein n=1 Tax=Clostridium kluyveri TaxID=1534 RepID=A0A1L5FCS3_CLOKL|nr:hypothetical protein [Clostridium kluyveri]APM40814.1 hypothetical protein BS101_19920 [Clostridium kluyveri]
MKDTILCLMDFFKRKNHPNSDNKFVTGIYLSLGIIMDIILFNSLSQLIYLDKIEKNIVVSGYFVMIIVIYAIVTIPSKIKNINDIKILFTLPINYKEIFISIILNDSTVFINIGSIVSFFVPALFFQHSFISFLILLLESTFIFIFAELLILILCVLIKLMFYGITISISTIIVIILIIIVVLPNYSSIICYFGHMYLYKAWMLCSIIFLLELSLCKTLQLMFICYKYFVQRC